MRWVALFLCLLAAPAWAQSGPSIRQSGNVTPTHAACWTTNGVVQDCGPATLGFLTSLGVTASGPGFCQNSGPVTSAYNQFCINVTQTGGASLSLYNYNGASGGFSFNINGTLQGFALVSLPVVVGDTACFTNTSGNLADCGGGTGTVSSVALALPTSVFTISGSPVTSSGTLTGAFASQTANYVFAAPNGSLGTPTFRALVGADIPAINLATAVTGTLGAANGGTGANNSSATGIQQWSSGTGSVSTALANGTTATTQSESDTSTKVATDAFIANITALSSLVTVGTLTGGSTSTGFTVGNGTALSGTLSGNPTYSGVPIFSGLTAGTCANGVGLDSSNDFILISCPGAASSIQIATTGIISGTTGYLLYNNGGVLGNQTLATILTVASNLTATGTTSVAISEQQTPLPGGRLTLQSATPVMTTTQSAKSTIYYDCFNGGGYVPVYNGTNIVMLPISSCEISTALESSGTGEELSGGVFDVFAVNVSGTLTLCVPTNGSGGGWASDSGSNTSRGTGYSQLSGTALQNGIYTNANTITHCYNGSTDEGSINANQATYLGTFYTTANGQTSYVFGTMPTSGNPTAGLFGIWNAYHRVNVATQLWSGVADWTYASTTIRQANASTTMQISYVVGLLQDGISAIVRNSITTGNTYGCEIGIGIDSTTTVSGGAGSILSTTGATITAGYNGIPGIGYHIISANEWSDSSSNTCTFFGYVGSTSGTLGLLSAILRM